jgi:hypothetical protein
MKVINKSRKIISINGEPFLPGKDMGLPEGFEKNPCVEYYLAKGILVDAAQSEQAASVSGISDEEKARIAEEAVAKYKADEEARAAAQAEKEAEINAVKAMKKKELLKKAAALSIEVEDSDDEETVREKILTALAE